jgi:3-methyladenine DNA glycosylase Tag
MNEPNQIRPQGLADYLDVLTRAVFQAGMNWRVIEAKWPGFVEAFHRFDPETVAALGVADIDALGADTRVIRNRPKIEATVANAVAEQLRSEFGRPRAHDDDGGLLRDLADYDRAFGLIDGEVA